MASKYRAIANNPEECIFLISYRYDIENTVLTRHLPFLDIFADGTSLRLTLCEHDTHF